MAIFQSDVVLRKQPWKFTTDSSVVAQRALFVPKAALAVGDMIELVVLPADHVLVDLTFDNDTLDSNGTPTLAGDIGIMSGPVGQNSTSRTVGQQFGAAQTWFRTAAGLQRAAATYRNIQNLLPATYDRSIAVKITAIAATANLANTAATNNRGMWQAATAYATGDYITLPNGLRARCTTAGTSGSAIPIEAFSTTLFGNTVTDGTVTWTMNDPYMAATIVYRSIGGGV